ncbi:radical SAM/SPASM domain-containing protein [Thiorhodococcus minor]|uniref:Radical SAM protein n=1 Tax=Thiorhodococcus minor TaxID=57489 RepID=A0A6M0JTT8_9GAMM|nr:radical SAM protein [Thiorhodococcus minor]NEV60351.1 radical SAM protein [Thiorhodococcus minor]
MFASKYNIITKLNRPVSCYSHIILNTLTGSMDALDQPSLRTIEALQAGAPLNREQERIAASLKHRGYFYDNRLDEERKVYLTVGAMKESGFIDKNPVFIILTSYNCNLACPYCFQQKTKPVSSVITPKQIENVFRAITHLARDYERDNVRIDLMGGEPLLPGVHYEQAVKEILARAAVEGFRVHITSNGTFLKDYVSILADNAVHSVQITVDGPPSVQEVRRPTKDRQRTSDMIFAGINEALQKGIRVSARTNLDHTNIEHLPALASFYEENGWLAHGNFLAYVSPVHDHSCIKGFPVDGELGLFEKYLELVNRYPSLDRAFQANNFGAYRYLGCTLSGGESPVPRIYRCEANVNEFVFDSAGNIYPCLESAGSIEHAVGAYEPEFLLQEVKLAEWRRRQVTELPECNDCVVRFVCAGGCMWHAMSQAGGGARSVACEPTEEEIRLFLARRGHELLAPALGGRATEVSGSAPVARRGR